MLLSATRLRFARCWRCAPLASLAWLSACGTEGSGALDQNSAVGALLADSRATQHVPPGSTAAPADAASLLAQRERGLFHHGLADPDAAIEHLLPVYRADPTDDTVALAVAEASLWKKDAATAQLVLSQLQAPDAPEALRVRGLMLEQTLRFAEALELYERAIPRLEEPWGTLERKAQVLSWSKRFDEARATYAVVAESSAASPELRRRCRLGMAEIRAWTKDLAGALVELAALSRDEPDFVGALLLAGQILEWQGELAPAKRTYSRVLSVDAQNTEARARLDRLLWVE